MTHLRVFFIGGYIAYRALFNWIRPAHYVPTLLGGPAFQILFFAYVGRFAQLRDDTFFVVGNAVQVSAMAGVYGPAMTVAGERWTQTLSPLLATPANRLALFLGRALPLLVQGLIISAFGFFVGWALLDFDPGDANLPALAVVVVVSAFACTCLGMLLGAFGLRARDAMFGANLVYFLLLLLCGVNVPVEELPGWLQAVSNILPLTHGIEAAREVAAGASLGDVLDLVGIELAAGAAYMTLAYGLFRFLEASGRRRASLETM